MAIDAAKSIVNVRDAFQDILAPDMRARKAELAGVRATIDRLEQKPERLERQVADGFAEMHSRLDVYADVQSVKERLARTEERDARPSA